MLEKNSLHCHCWNAKLSRGWTKIRIVYWLIGYQFYFSILKYSYIRFWEVLKCCWWKIKHPNSFHNRHNGSWAEEELAGGPRMSGCRSRSCESDRRWWWRIIADHSSSSVVLSIMSSAQLNYSAVPLPRNALSIMQIYSFPVSGRRQSLEVKRYCVLLLDIFRSNGYPNMLIRRGLHQKLVSPQNNTYVAEVFC